MPIGHELKHVHKKIWNHNSHHFQAKKHKFKSKICVSVKVSHTIYKKIF
jgi:hypothetical protein